MSAWLFNSYIEFLHYFITSEKIKCMYGAAFPRRRVVFNVSDSPSSVCSVHLEDKKFSKASDNKPLNGKQAVRRHFIPACTPEVRTKKQIKRRETSFFTVCTFIQSHRAGIVKSFTFSQTEFIANRNANSILWKYNRTKETYRRADAAKHEEGSRD